MASYTLRHIDGDLWKRLKSKAASQGTSIKDLIEKLIRAWVAEPDLPVDGKEQS